MPQIPYHRQSMGYGFTLCISCMVNRLLLGCQNQLEKYHTKRRLDLTSNKYSCTILKLLQKHHHQYATNDHWTAEPLPDQWRTPQKLMASCSEKSPPQKWKKICWVSPTSQMILLNAQIRGSYLKERTYLKQPQIENLNKPVNSKSVWPFLNIYKTNTTLRSQDQGLSTFARVNQSSLINYDYYLQTATLFAIYLLLTKCKFHSIPKYQSKKKSNRDRSKHTFSYQLCWVEPEYWHPPLKSMMEEQVHAWLISFKIMTCFHRKQTLHTLRHASNMYSCISEDETSVGKAHLSHPYHKIKLQKIELILKPLLLLHQLI